MVLKTLGRSGGGLTDPQPRTVLARGTKLMCHGICAAKKGLVQEFWSGNSSEKHDF